MLIVHVYADIRAMPVTMISKNIESHLNQVTQATNPNLRKDLYLPLRKQMLINL